jgi:hypothetical protein
MVGEGSPEGRGQGCNEALGAQYGTHPEEGLLERIGTDVEDIEGEEDIDKIEGKGCSELRKGDEDEITPTGLFYSHLC